MTITRTKKIFLKRPIYKIPCKEEGCKIVIHTRSFNRKKCYRHVPNAKYKISQRSKDKRKLMKSPYDIKPKKRRPCLKCGEQFDSVSNYNRVCTPCNNENDSLKGEMSFHGWKLMRSNEFDQTIKYHSYETGPRNWQAEICVR